MAEAFGRDRVHAATIVLVVGVGVVSVLSPVLVQAGQPCFGEPGDPLLCSEAGLTAQIVQMWVVALVAVTALVLTRRVRTAPAHEVCRAARLPVAVALGNLLFVVVTSLVLLL